MRRQTSRPPPSESMRSARTTSGRVASIRARPPITVSASPAISMSSSRSSTARSPSRTDSWPSRRNTRMVILLGPFLQRGQLRNTSGPQRDARPTPLQGIAGGHTVPGRGPLKRDGYGPGSGFRNRSRPRGRVQRTPGSSRAGRTPSCRSVAGRRRSLPPARSDRPTP